MTNENIVYVVKGAITLLRGEERPLQPGANERSFAHRLAVHMEEGFAGWDVDCEYNKHGMDIKALEGVEGCDEQKKTDRIHPDIIVHKRTNESPVEENLLVIEMKRNDACDLCDQRKLQLLTDQGGEYRYQLGLYINIQSNQFIRTWHSDGGVVEEAFLLGE